MDSNTNQTFGVILGLTTIVATLLTTLVRRKECFTSGFGFDMPPSDHPLYLNMYDQNLTTDFGLFNLVQTLKYKYFKPMSRGIQTNAGLGQVSLGPKLSPVILIPGLGTSPLLATWNKNDTVNVKNLDFFKNFESSESWDCRRLQYNWSPIWFPKENLNENPETKGIAQYCWADNVRVVYNPETNKIENSPGVVTEVPNFGSADFVPKSYMEPLIRALEATGYVRGSSLFAAAYDFRKIASKDVLMNYCSSLKSLIENSVATNGYKATIVAHDLGAPLVNYFFSICPQEWKDMYIERFVSISGAFGGCPKALRTLLSGTEVYNPKEKEILRQVSKNYSGIQWMLPCPSVYGDFKLVNYRERSYTAKDITQLLQMAGYEEAVGIYNNLVLPVQTQSLQAPHVTTYVLAGQKVMTESSYTYSNSLTQSPVTNYPYYQTDLPYGNNFDFPQHFNGDGTMPKFALEVPMQWTNSQRHPIFYRFYHEAQHKEILELQDPIKDLLSIIFDS